MESFGKIYRRLFMKISGKNFITLHIFRFLVASVLILSSIATMATPVFAAGNETWYAESGYVGKMRVVNDTYTYTKTMGRSGTLNFAIVFGACREGYCSCSDNENSTSSNIRVTCNVYTTSGEFLGSGYMDESISNCFNLVTNRSLNVGEEIILYFDISTEPGEYVSGNWRQAHISYWYSFT